MATENRSTSSTAAGDDALVGFHDDVLAIKKQLCGESRQRQFIPIVGMGGIGKTTLAVNVYHDPSIQALFDICGWVTVSQSYSHEEVFSTLLRSFKPFDVKRVEECHESPADVSEQSPDSTESPAKVFEQIPDPTDVKVFKTLYKRKYLIVLDDIWDTGVCDDLNRICPDDGNGSRIILTTRRQDVATYYGENCSPPHEMRLMHEDQSWELLRPRVFMNGVCDRELEDIGKAIARSCGGLPLAIVVVAGLLSTVDRARASWEEIAEKVNSVVAARDGKLEKILSLSYTDLPRHLKLCFAYMGGFPEDRDINVEKLIKLWIAEGFVEPIRAPKSSEEVAEECLQDLIKRSLVFDGRKNRHGKLKSCRLHDLIRDLSRAKADEDKIPLYDTNVLGTLVETTLEDVKLLRVLEWGGADQGLLSTSQIFSWFSGLRYLVLDCFVELPAAVSNLENLQTLIINAYEGWVRLPREIWRMQQLRHLVSSFDQLPCPQGATSFPLENLQTLSRMGATSVIIAHGGTWVNNVYEGGRREYMPISPNGITFIDLLGKLELRLMKDRTVYMYEIDALFQSSGCEVMRMKITDDFELSHLFNSVEMPILHVTVYLRSNDLGKHVLHHPVVEVSASASASSNFNSSDNQLDGLENACEVADDVDEEDEGDDDDEDFDDCFGRDRDNLPHDSDEESGDNHHPTSQWIIPGAAYQASVPCQELGIEEDDSSSDTFSIGATFQSKDKIVVACGVYHLINHAAFITVRSSLSRYYVVCKFGGGCPFVIRGRALEKMWTISEFVPHNCTVDLRYHAAPKVSSKVLASYFLPDVMAKGVTLTPRTIQALLQHKYGISVMYSTALAGRNLALKMTYGDPDTSFHIMPKYLYMLQHVNPGSVVDVQANEDNVFQYAFIALSACIRAFKSCRPMIVIDGTHLKGKYKGILFVVVAKDTNEQILPLAFGIADKECDASWIWFLKRLRHTFGVRDELLFVSDQHVSIRKAIEHVFLGTPQALCAFHIQSNLKHWGSHVVTLFKLAAKAYKIQDFEQYMENLKAVKPRAY